MNRFKDFGVGGGGGSTPQILLSYVAGSYEYALFVR